MTDVQELIELIKLERKGETVFLGKNYLSPWKRVFGGQVLAQALSAATQTVSEDRGVHSLHSYFLLPGDIEVPIVFEVERVRDGGSFSTRRVVAKQNGIPIFILSASFQIKGQEGFDHSLTMPQVKQPEELQSDEEIIKKYEKYIPNSLAELIYSRPFDFKIVEGFDLFDQSRKAPIRHVWFKTKQKADVSPDLHQQMMTYVSDYNLLITSTLPHIDGPYPTNVFMASLDHAIWFHREVNVNDWLLYALDSPSASNTRGFTRGNIFTRDGKLVASVAQEGLIRPLNK
ncbi:acyl-CoA thioesterase [Leadbetterella byssophila]|jgi:acyl-CoA thioesterase-2|uniref:Acyl-CoA thioesterase 2 n=1 Tax=Leadbetterella byssophila (strain DSM 17132 / JCM 16389 / KACC 11308 / NBRC 106382 / 4M15) TaxID=649349 RepID=E4RU91_LEAB4|nr:acyl-CoA thioesterase II [Leadbetterella byssophila]ADQ16925.1 Choloyl-CoA hydrolase [Leadbetterella byssophila DSM 17132]